MENSKEDAYEKDWQNLEEQKKKKGRTKDLPKSPNHGTKDKNE